jgi:hypothetical protein
MLVSSEHGYKLSDFIKDKGFLSQLNVTNWRYFTLLYFLLYFTKEQIIYNQQKCDCFILK